MNEETTDSGKFFFDLRNESWEADFMKINIEKSGTSSEISTSGKEGEKSWVKFSEELNTSEDEVSRAETYILGSQLREYSVEYIQPDWEAFKDKSEIAGKRRKFFLISKAAEVYLLLAFCALLTYWGTRTGLLLRDSNINWDTIAAHSPFLSSSGLLKEGKAYHKLNHSENNKASEIDGYKDIALFNISPVTSLLDNTVYQPVREKEERKGIVNLLRTGLEKNETLFDKNNFLSLENITVSYPVSSISRSRIKISPYIKISIAGNLLNISTPLVPGDFDRRAVVPGAGVEVGIELEDKWRISTGINYQQVKYDGVTSTENTINVLSVPLKIKYKIAESSKTSVYVTGAFSSNYILAGKYEDIIHISPKYPYTVTDYLENPEDVKRAMVVSENVKDKNSFRAVSIGLGMERKIDSTTTVFANAVYSASLGKGVGKNFEKIRGIGIELGAKLLI